MDNQATRQQLHKPRDRSPAQKPGALTTTPPKVIWVKMLKRPYNGMQEFDRVLALCNRFNNALEETLATTPAKLEHLILSIKVEEGDFYPTGSLNPDGEVNFWKEINECISKFEIDKINLKPRAKKDFTPDPSAHHHQQHRRKMPTPPPQHRNSSKDYF